MTEQKPIVPSSTLFLPKEPPPEPEPDWSVYWMSAIVSLLCSSLILASC